jgi:hypothetical protein
MANEIRITAGLTCTNGNLTFNKSLSVTADQTTAKGPNPGTIDVTTTEATVNFGSVSAPRWALFSNLGTNPVNIGAGTALVSFMQLKGGEPALVPLVPSVTVRVQATTGTTRLQIEALET